MHEPFWAFDVFYKSNNPNKCQICVGQGRLKRFYSPVEAPCTFCDGTGESNAPLFTDDNSEAFDLWLEGR